MLNKKGNILKNKQKKLITCGATPQLRQKTANEICECRNAQNELKHLAKLFQNVPSYVKKIANKCNMWHPTLTHKFRNYAVRQFVIAASCHQSAGIRGGDDAATDADITANATDISDDIHHYHAE